MKLFNVWKYFSEDATNIKDKLWTIASWLFTLLGGIIGFIAKDFKSETFAFEEPKLVIVIALVGIILSAYTYWMITEYGWHIRTAWNRTDFLRSKIEGLEEVWQAGYISNDDEEDNEDEKERLPKFVRRLLALCVLFGVAFLGLLILAIVQ